MEFFDVFAKKIPATPAPGEFLLGFVRNSFAIADGGFAEIETIPSANKVVEKPRQTPNTASLHPHRSSHYQRQR